MIVPGFSTRDWTTLRAQKWLLELRLPPIMRISWCFLNCSSALFHISNSNPCRYGSSFSSFNASSLFSQYARIFSGDILSISALLSGGMAGCGDQVRGIANDNRLSIVGHLGAGNLLKFFYEPLSVGGDRGADFQTPLPPHLSLNFYVI